MCSAREYQLIHVTPCKGISTHTYTHTKSEEIAIRTCLGGWTAGITKRPRKIYVCIYRE